MAGTCCTDSTETVLQLQQGASIRDCKVQTALAKNHIGFVCVAYAAQGVGTNVIRVNE
jgi:hypothetical protein